jgi:hypothetical protein
MSKRKSTSPQATIANIAAGAITVMETMKEILMGTAMKCEFQFDIGQAVRGLAEAGLYFTTKDLEGMLLAYCNIIKDRNERVIKVEIEHPSPEVVIFAFTVRVFDGKELPLIDEEAAQRLFVSSNDFQKLTAVAKVHAR